MKLKTMIKFYISVTRMVGRVGVLPFYIFRRDVRQSITDMSLSRDVVGAIIVLKAYGHTLALATTRFSGAWLHVYVTGEIPEWGGSEAKIERGVSIAATLKYKLIELRNIVTMDDFYNRQAE